MPATPPPHLACALLGACVFLLGTGASCERQNTAERPAEGRSAQTGAQQPGDEQPQPGNQQPGDSAPPGQAHPPAPLPQQKVLDLGDTREGVAATTAAAPPSATTAAAAPASAGAPRRYVIAALGDSLTDKRSGGGGYLDVVAHACPKSAIDNFGKGGDMVNQMRRRFERELLPQAAQRGYTHLVLYGGVNDLYSDETAGRTNELIQGDLSAIYRQARAAGMQVVAITVSPWGGFTRYFNPRRAEATRQLNAWIAAQVAEGLIDGVVDSYPLLSCGDPERLCPDHAQRDGLHLASSGQQLLGQALLEAAFSNCQ